MKIGIASDHGGYDLKEALKDYLADKGYQFEDYGTYSTESVDYPDYAHLVARAIQQGKLSRGILICGSGIGISMAANRFIGIRAALCSEPLSAELSRRHNDANVLCLGGRLIGREMAYKIADTWLSTEFEGGRHQGRIDKLDII